MKFKSLLICLVLCHGFLPIHAGKFEKLQPLIKIYSFVPWQQLFNVSLLGALGWLGYDNFQLRKSSLTKEEAKNTFQPMAAMKNYVTEEKAQQAYGPLNVGQYMLRTEGLTTKDAADTYLPKTAAQDFVQKTKEENDKLAQTVVSLTLPAFNKQFVNINTFNALKDMVATKEEVAAIQQQVATCVTRQDLQDIITELHKRFDTRFTQLKEEQTKGFADVKEGLQTISRDMASSFVTINTKINQLPTDQNFIEALTPKIISFVNQTEDHDDQPASNPQFENENE